MASVTESSLNLAAHEIVADFKHEGVALNDAVIKKAAELGLNTDQTNRLIERTNSEAFLSLFPEKTDFEVADPKVVLASKVASETVTKVASESVKKMSYYERLDRDPYDIFGVEPETCKTASETKTARDIYIERIEATNLIDSINMDKTARLMLMEESDSTLWNVFKEEAMGGRSVSSMEKELVLAYPEKVAAVCAVVDALVDKLASYNRLDVNDYARLEVEDLSTNEVVLSSKLTEAFRGVLEYGTTN